MPLVARRLLGVAALHLLVGLPMNRPLVLGHG
jgi:hypothetical protein